MKIVTGITMFLSQLSNVPAGYQDETGFHQGDPAPDMRLLE